jgi:hypothetical protein
MSDNLFTEILKKQTNYKVGINSFCLRYVVKITHFAIYTSGDAGAVTMSSSKSNVYMVIR